MGPGAALTVSLLREVISEKVWESGGAWGAAAPFYARGINKPSLILRHFTQKSGPAEPPDFILYAIFGFVSLAA